MAQLLTTKSLAAHLEDIIRKSKGEVYLISYSFRISPLSDDFLIGNNYSYSQLRDRFSDGNK